MNAFKVGDVVRVARTSTSAGPAAGSVVVINEVDLHDDTVRVSWDGGDNWWFGFDDVELLETVLPGAGIVEQMAAAHGNAWRKLMAATPRDRFEAEGWRCSDDGWDLGDGARVELNNGYAYFHGFEDSEGEAWGLDSDTLREFADLLDEVTP